MIAIQPWSSQVFRCMVSPSMVYFELVRIFSGWFCGVTSMAAIMAMISPTWFNCGLPGFLSAWLFSWFGLNHIPLPLCVSCFPLFRHTLSVYTLISWSLRVVLFTTSQLASRFEILSGFVNTQKHLARLCLSVIDGSKIIVLFFSLAVQFHCLQLLVRDKSPCVIPGVSRLSLGAILSSLYCASRVHVYRAWHPSNRSLEQLGQ